MDIKYIDVHGHLNFSAYSADREEVIRRMKDSKVGVITVGTSKKTSEEAVALSSPKDARWAIIGLHPIHTVPSHHDLDEEEKDSLPEIEFDYAFYKTLALKSEVLGLGECGLDFFHPQSESEQKNQYKIFENHINLANEVNKPLMLHLRNSKDGTLNAYNKASEMISSIGVSKCGDVHFFAGTTDDMKVFLDLGFYISFTGVITFAKNYEDLVRYCPTDRILSETDCPYVAPIPYRGKRNEPTYVIEVVNKIAEIKKISQEEARQEIINNAKTLFNF